MGCPLQASGSPSAASTEVLLRFLSRKSVLQQAKQAKRRMVLGAERGEISLHCGFACCDAFALVTEGGRTSGARRDGRGGSDIGYFRASSYFMFVLLDLTVCGSRCWEGSGVGGGAQPLVRSWPLCFNVEGFRDRERCTSFYEKEAQVLL